MPYYLHAKTEPVTSHYAARKWHAEAFAERAAAYESLKRQFSVETHTVTFLPNREELTAWRSRENERFSSGTYTRTPWYDRDNHADHFAHFSLDKPGLLAYTKDPEHGIQDKQTRVRPGKYLTEFYAGSFTPEEIAAYVAQCAAYADPSALKLARTVDEIRAIYNRTVGPDSCMRRKINDGDVYLWQQKLDDDTDPYQWHPCDVYADSDLAVAYIGDLRGEISQRGVVWPDQKRYYRLYGTGPLEALLRMNGYTYAEFNGARIRRIDCRIDRAKAVVLPYLDGIQTVSEVPDTPWLQIDSDGEIHADLTDGYVILGHTIRCESCDRSNYEGATECRHCDYSFNGDDDDDDTTWCCDNCGGDYGDDDSQTEVWSPNRDARIWICDNCYADWSIDCDHCGESFCERETFNRVERQARRAEGLTQYCDGCVREIRVERTATIEPTDGATYYGVVRCQSSGESIWCEFPAHGAERQEYFGSFEAACASALTLTRLYGRIYTYVVEPLFVAAVDDTTETLYSRIYTYVVEPLFVAAVDDTTETDETEVEHVAAV